MDALTRERFGPLPWWEQHAKPFPPPGVPSRPQPPTTEEQEQRRRVLLGLDEGRRA